MKKDKNILILNHLSTTEYTTSSAIAIALGLSSRTIRTALKELDVILHKHGARLITKPHYGTMLDIFDYNAYNTFYQQENALLMNTIQPVDPYERIDYLITLFLNNNDYILLDDLSETLYISRNSLTNDLKKVREYFCKFSLTIINKPNYGLKLTGKESNFRLCMLNRELTYHSQPKQYNTLLTFLKTLFQEYDFSYFGNTIHELTLFFLIARTRIRDGHFIQESQSFYPFQEMMLAQKIYHYLFDADIPDNEYKYASMFLSSRRSYPLTSPYLFHEVNFEIQNIIIHILEELNKYYQINLFDKHDYDIELRNYLSVHMIPLVVRIKNDIQFHNPILQEIKVNHTLSFLLATIASQYLSSYYKKAISEDEIGYITLLLDLAIKKRTTYSNEKNILLVCDYGRGAQQLLKFQFEQTFPKYIKELTVTDSHFLQSFNNIDYIFTTTPLSNIDIPTLDISFDLTEYQIDEIKKILRKPKKLFETPTFKKQFFYSHLHLKSKEEVIQFIIKQFTLTKKISSKTANELENNLVDSYIANSTAIVTPVYTVTQETIPMVLLLERPIKWDDHKVQMIFAILNDQKLNRYLLRFYDILSQLILDYDRIQEVIRKKDFKTLQSKFNEVDKILPK